MKKVTKIAANTTSVTERPKLRVAAYCRVSTGSEEQMASLETQKKHYESHINSNPEWVLAGLYCDEAVTGTKKEKRPGLLGMIADCENKKIDFIVTKSISRFARNTTDCLELVRKLQSLGVFIYFEKENINTGSMEDEFMLSILSGMAKNESVSIAENNKWSVQKRFQTGTYKIPCPPYGYNTMDGKLVLNEPEAEIVRYIFAELLSGEGITRIVNKLNRRKVPSRRGGPWTETTVRGMVRNEKYIGEAIFQKTYTDEYFNRHQNYGEKEQYLIRNHHEAIISHEDFEATQAIIAQRSKEKGVEKHNEKYRKRYPFSGKVICGDCGGTFKRRIHSGGKTYIAWCCKTHIEEIEKCAMKFITESDFEYAFVSMVNKLIFGHETVLKPLLIGLRGINSGDGLQNIQEIDQRLKENAEQQDVLVSLMGKGILEPAIYRKSNNELLQEAEGLRQQKDSLHRLMNSGTQSLEGVRELLNFVSKAEMLDRFDADVFERFVERIIVCSRTEIGFELKCGITLKERLVK